MKNMQKIFKSNYGIKLCLPLVIIYGVFTPVFIFERDTSIYMQVFFILGLVSTLLMVPSLSTLKICINSNELTVKSFNFIKYTSRSWIWIDITRIELYNEKVILTNKLGKKISFNKSFWKDFDQFVLLIYQSVVNNSPNCKIDKSFIDYLKLMDNSNKMNSNIEIKEASVQDSDHIAIYKKYKPSFRDFFYKLLLSIVLIFVWTILLALVFSSDNSIVYIIYAFLWYVLLLSFNHFSRIKLS